MNRIPGPALAARPGQAVHIPLPVRRETAFVSAVDPSPSVPDAQGPTPLMVFRGDSRAPRRLHPLEMALLTVTAVHLCFLPWAFGGMTKHPWPEWVSLGLAAVGF